MLIVKKGHNLKIFLIKKIKPKKISNKKDKTKIHAKII